MSTAIAQVEPGQVLPPRAPITPMEMIDRALSSGAGVDVLERLMALQERYDAAQATKAFNLAVAAAKREIPVIKKVRKVDFTSQKGRTNYDYEDLAEIARTVDPILAKHGLNYRFRTLQGDGGMITVTCILSHEAGHSEENSLSAGRDESGNKNNIQAVGSTQTYLQRYTLKAALGLAATKDDDAGAAGAGEVVNGTQEETLRGLITEAKADIGGFLEYYGADSLSDFPKARFNDAVGMLRTKVARLAKDAANG